MVQEFNVLRCFSCKRFQVHQVKKAKNWICKVCGEKQSISKVYGQGRAADCRRHVQKLNTIQGEREQFIAEKVIDDDDFEEFDYDGVVDPEQMGQENLSNERDQVGSKWEKFVETENKNEETLEEEFFNGLPITMDKKAFDDGTKRDKQPKKWKKNTQRNDELLPQKKRGAKTQDIVDNDENEFQQRHCSKRKNVQKGKELEEKSKSKWEIFNSNSEETSLDEEDVPCIKNNGIATSKSMKFDTVKLSDSSVKHYSHDNQNSPLKSISFQAKNKAIPCTSNTKTSQSKWSKFLGSSNSAHEHDKLKGENDESYSKFDTSENSPEKRQLVIPGRQTCSKTMNSLRSMCDISSVRCVESNEAKNESGIPIPSFLLNARATRSKPEADKRTNSCQSNQEASSFSSKDLFTIDDDELGDDWWNV